MIEITLVGMYADTSPACVSMIGNAAFVFVVGPGLGVTTLAEFITLAKEKPNQLSYGSGGNGSIQHLFSELMQTMAGIRMVHVPYRGDNPVLTDIIAGHIPAAFVEMGVEPVAVDFKAEGGWLRGVLPPRSGEGPWVVRVEVKDHSGRELGRDFVEVAAAAAAEH